MKIGNRLSLSVQLGAVVGVLGLLIAGIVGSPSVGSASAAETRDGGYYFDALKESTAEVIDEHQEKINRTPDGNLMWDVVRDYILKNKGKDNVLKLPKINHPKLVNVATNPGIADYPGDAS